MRLRLRPPETEFERGVRRFGYLLLEVTLLLVVAIFASNVLLARPVIDSFLFALALAVGLTPQLLPAIISVNLARGAKRMAQRRVIVKRLAAIENFGSMDVLCTDKTGTLTEGVIRLQAALDIAGKPSEDVLLYAYLNASYETGFANPIDAAIRSHGAFDLSAYTKLDEVPYDFLRKRLSMLVAHGHQHVMITKGALSQVLAVCTSARTEDGEMADIATVQARIQQHFEEFSAHGLRTLGVAYRDVGTEVHIAKEHETGMTLAGFLVFADTPKPRIAETLAHLKRLGVSLKMITGDNQQVAAAIGRQIGIPQPQVISGADLHQMRDEALIRRLPEVDIVAEVEPNQKERIILALRKAGHVVGYMGDGINDASALHAADVGLSVAEAVDVAREAADIVLLDKDLDVLIQGVRDGRTTFANTLKYVFMASSANFGNMFSMAGASLFLPFLPLLPKQILLTNLLTDLPEMTIAADSVDEELVERPQRWNIRFIRTFMLTFGALCSLFDYLTFGVLLFLLHATTEQFRTAWFVESVVSAALIVLAIRSRRPFFASKPSPSLLLTTLLTVGATLWLPYTPLAWLFGFRPLPGRFLLALGMLVAGYVGVVEATKQVFYARVKL